jgi:DNA (cytosine-5)-methyltransferase 1
MIKYGSVCSGIEAASVAWEGLGWEAQWFSEIEKFPSAVLKRRFTDVPNIGDMTKLKENEIYGRTTIDLLVGGTPCQSFSIAGLRKGLDDERGNLALEYCRILRDKQPRWFVWENVPGVLSSGGGKDFKCILEAFVECGYSVSWRILDAQYFGVAQRRRRVFVVGHLGDDWRPSAAVLFERESLSGDLATGRKKRKGSAGKTEASVGASSEWWDGSQTAATLTKQNANGAQRMPDKDNFGAVLTRAEGSQQARPAEKVGTLDGQYGDKQGLEDQHINSGASKFVPHVVQLGHSKSNGLGISETETASTLEAVLSANQAVIYENHPNDSRITECSVISPTLHSRMGTGGGNVPLTITEALIVLNDQGGDSINVEKDDISPTLRSETHGHEPIISIQGNLIGRDSGGPAGVGVSEGETMYTMTQADVHGVLTGTFDKRAGKEGGGKGILVQDEKASTLDTNMTQKLFCHMVRRLTPTECERLQGFEDGWTNIPGAKDGPRYKALGNSMAVPVMSWIGRRIQMYEEILKTL